MIPSTPEQLQIASPVIRAVASVAAGLGGGHVKGSSEVQWTGLANNSVHSANIY